MLIPVRLWTPWRWSRQTGWGFEQPGLVQGRWGGIRKLLRSLPTLSILWLYDSKCRILLIVVCRWRFQSSCDTQGRSGPCTYRSPKSERTHPKKRLAVLDKFFLVFVYHIEFIFLGFHGMLTCGYLHLNLPVNPILSELNCSRHSHGVVHIKFI